MSETVTKTNLLGLSLPKLQAYFVSMDEKPFRAVQVMKWIHQRGVTDFDAMTDISKSLRDKLKTNAEIRLPNVVQEYLSSDGCYKWIVQVASGSRVETVYIPEAGRATLCISSQAGCTLDCSFCATGKQGFNSNLTTAEIIGQLWWANHRLNGFAEPRAGAGKSNRAVSNIVMMGMGEPLLNFDNVMDALHLMMEDNAYGLSKRRVTVSTAGVVPAIDRMKDYTDASLAISLHAPNDELRNQIVPVNKKYPIRELLRSVKDYMASLPDKRVPVVEYTLIAGVNDHRQHARELAALLKDFPCKINLIPFNPFEQSDYRRPSNSSVNTFREILQQADYTVTVRTTRGDDIGAACGQLVGEVADQTKRSARYRKAAELSAANRLDVHNVV
ncbi:23S rRNA (adenine(2503)-C(2))-methyltransferase RlmN [Pseudohongiella sp. SYSU M77423]|uniref:23S rRNA (adenine(2503)-C(2))-methyltransferase RlmN n=1 Tax=Pseudohongiella sp. SYSU M77423 TaxID=3042312 RepID=UPI000C53F203|nr:23S rRNA (adenine(2503)-C(2))-methyltransferase RlmN [Pseudohongiella sp. SYSU M77423]MAY54457.1 23S rRNA (adenine(2503)-C(2))-methyltransferase RlmN [Gammaproteobacteria bacterium]MEC8859185.1 23S rRNA (adenine(2503)-C(2))-methyltransferase RlmN [Pseudomonadota bacterium]HBN15441.1 23S rRNA (adenine(2503)-C(2))-methyltransferase RlmN [Pseudohongiella sp.]MBJ56202.1 23S rRNA (adenine(2503)-C(2))-methyltransferase RlmN [Gammaproteobacteria bacterium]MDH7943542.1 23S rRNA (adenine(2503)-C(2))|tara:strand:- start:1066 stop:2226 length:1161 start_codon:yes stop_codon:yes gene_type:complete